MIPRKEITICLGSSCFSRGNKEILPVVQEYLRKYNLEGEVKFRGNHCFDNCRNGPSIKFGSKVYNELTKEKVIEILDRELGSLIGDVKRSSSKWVKPKGRMLSKFAWHVFKKIKLGTLNKYK